MNATRCPPSRPAAAPSRKPPAALDKDQPLIDDIRLLGRLLGDVIDAQAKADWLVRLRDEMGLAPAQTIAMGDGANDLKMLAVAGLGVGMHPKPVVRQHADVSLRYVGLDGLPRLFAPAVS